MRVVMTGSHGLIGTALRPALEAAGHEVVRLVRGAPGGPGEVRWDPARGELDPADLAGVDAAINLAGAGVGDHRWTDGYKRTILDSRVQSTSTLSRALASLDPLPRVLVSASAVGYYGDRGEEVLTEASARGDSFLSDVTQAWESAADPAREAGIRVAHPRTGLVMARHGGAFAQLLLLAKVGLAGPLGSGQQWWPWITLPDEISALLHLLDSDLSGPVNLSGPDPARCIQVIRALASTLHRPALVPAPAFALRLVLGEFAGDILASQRVVPAELARSGFTFQHSTLEAAARWTVGG